MNQQREEERIKELFQQLKQDDEQRAPSFASVWQAVRARRERPVGRWAISRVALAAVLLMTFAAGGVFFRRIADSQVAQPPDAPEVSVPQIPHVVSPPSLALTNHRPLKVVRRRVPAQRLPLEAMVSQWRSPTDFLLKVPGERWLKEVPRLGVPRVEIKPLEFELKNEMEAQ